MDRTIDDDPLHALMTLFNIIIQTYYIRCDLLGSKWMTGMAGRTMISLYLLC